METEYQLKMQQRLKNYIEYYDTICITKRYSLQELMDMTEMELLALIPNNQTVDEYSEKLGYETIKNITGFQMHKVIDGSWHIGFYEANRNKPQKDQFILFEITYVKNLKIGLIDLFLIVQNRNIENWNGIKSGRIKISLGESWDDRASLGLK